MITSTQDKRVSTQYEVNKDLEEAIKEERNRIKNIEDIVKETTYIISPKNKGTSSKSQKRRKGITITIKNQDTRQGSTAF